MERLFWVCLGGAVGTGARYLTSVWVAERFGGPFPLGTLIVNLSGCFLIGLVMHATLTLPWPATLRAAITVGFLGGLTTYSSFNHETTSLLLHGANGLAALNALTTLVGGFVAGWLGVAVGRAVVG